MAKPTSVNPATPDSALAVVQGGPLATVKALLQTVPDAEADPTSRMLQFILDNPATNWENLWQKVDNLRDNAGRSFRLHAFRQMTSDFESELGIYLLCDVDWLPDETPGLLACSSEVSMVQMIALQRDNKLPADLEIVKKDKPTKAGFYPIHLRYLDPTQAAAGDPTKVVATQ